MPPNATTLPRSHAARFALLLALGLTTLAAPACEQTTPSADTPAVDGGSKEDAKSKAPAGDSKQSGSADAKAAAAKSSADPRAELTAFRGRLEKMFHALPPPEALERPLACPEFVAPKDGSMRIPVIDRSLLQFFATLGLPRPAAKKPSADSGVPAMVEGLSPLNSGVFTNLRALELQDRDPPHADAPAPAAILSEITKLEKNERLLVVLGDLDPEPPRGEHFKGGAYRGHVVFYNLGSGRPCCYEPFIAETNAKDAKPEAAAAVYAELVTRTRAAVDAAVERQIPGLKVMWPST